MKHDFHGKCAIVTGAARGIGRCIATRLMEAGCSVAVIDMLDAQDAGYDFFMQGDIADSKVLERFAGEVIARFGRVDCIVNNACYSNRGIHSGCSWEDFNHVLMTGVSAPYYLALLMKAHFGEGASIVNIASSRAFMSQADTESYSAAKGGIVALTHALAMSLAGKVRVNSVAPGWIETDPEAVNSHEDHVQQPVGRIGTPDDIANTVLFLLGPDSGFISGENIMVDGGMSKNMIYHNDFGWIYHPEN